MNKESSQLIRGLEGVVAAETKLCDLDGGHGRLAYAGYDIEDLARRATFEEVCHLLWWGELPTAAQLDKTTLAPVGPMMTNVAPYARHAGAVGGVWGEDGKETPVVLSMGASSTAHRKSTMFEHGRPRTKGGIEWRRNTSS